MNKLIENLKSTMVISDDNYSSISVRAPQKVATMLNVMSAILEKPVSSMLTDEISRNLAKLLLCDKENFDLLKEFLKEHDVGGGCLRILVEDGVIEDTNPLGLKFAF